MKQFFSSFWHILKNMKLELLLILVIIFGDYGLFRFVINLVNPSLLDRFLIATIHYWFYLLPILFVYSLYRGEKKQLLYPADSHQITKHYHLLIKYLIFVGAMILKELIFTVYYLLMFYNIIPKSKIAGGAFAGPEVFFGDLMYIFSYIFFALSLVCAAWGIMKVVKSFRPFVGLAVLIIGFGVYFNLSSKIGDLGNAHTVKEYLEGISYELLFSLCLGSILCANGVYFQKKFGDV